jgi:peptidoglycan/xylan/chitin deacetylase (PgdA/CDA1 family)
MLFKSVLFAAPLPLFAYGANIRRQLNDSTPETLTSAASSAVDTPPPTVSFSLLSTNPTAFPLSDIVESPSTHPTIALEWTFTAGEEPTDIVSATAPPLPSVSSVVISDYPALDIVPPTNSSEVAQWILEVQNSGITIPNIPPTVPGGCPTNPNVVTNTSVCWWTCGQCTRPSDITTCPDKWTWGLSYDDGPSPDTPRLLDYLSQQNLKSTFFIVGSRAISRQDILQAEFMLGHQLSVHTWSHPSLTTLTNEQVIAELGWTAKIIKEVTGLTPNTMRPPYGDIDDRIRAIALAMGFTPIIWTGYNDTNFDTNDWHIAAGTVSASGVLAAFETIMQEAGELTTGFIVLAHDLYQQSVDLATGYILPDALAKTDPPFNIMSIIECLGQPLSNAYKETNNNSTNPPPTGTNQAPVVNPSGTSTSSTSSHTGAGVLSTSPNALWQMALWLIPLIAPIMML